MLGQGKRERERVFTTLHVIPFYRSECFVMFVLLRRCLILTLCFRVLKCIYIYIYTNSDTVVFFILFNINLASYGTLQEWREEMFLQGLSELFLQHRAIFLFLSRKKYREVSVFGLILWFKKRSCPIKRGYCHWFNIITFIICISFIISISTVFNWLLVNLSCYVLYCSKTICI